MFFPKWSSLLGCSGFWKVYVLVFFFFFLPEGFINPAFISRYIPSEGLLRCHNGKESTCQCRRLKRHRFSPRVGKILWSRKWQSSPVFLPGKFHGQRSLAGYNPWGSQKIGHDWALMLAHILSEKIRCESVSIHEIFNIKEFTEWVIWYPVAARGAEKKWDTGNINYDAKEDGNMVTCGDAWKNMKAMKYPES